MRITKSECCECGLPCLKQSCKYYSVTRYYCDKCGEEGKLYHYNGLELCLDCIIKKLPVVEGSDVYA